jgi:1-phosphatidylinositol-3-phosphate 5-kinase
MKSRYSVIRGKRARPVASARATVEVLDSVKDATKDESDSSDSSSEADDEDEGVEERTVPEHVVPSSPEADPTSPEATVKTAPPGVISFPDVVNDQETRETEVPLPGPISLPPSPFLSATKNDPSLTPPASDLELAASGVERPSILKAISGFLLQQPPPSRSNEDLISDPEHIFRDSSMIVRTDEPTSIIALALKYALPDFLRCALTFLFSVRLSIVICSLNPVLKNGRLGKPSSTKVGKPSCLMIGLLQTPLPLGVSSMWIQGKLPIPQKI